jgi:NAD(P)-dependent dehydrogenase (short-subunit alcohol dehydrogenase family)
MHNKAILITGASKGIGASCADIFAQNGAKIIFFVDSDFECVNAQALRIAAKNGCECIPVRAEATDEREVRTVFDIIKDKAGRIDVLVNCVDLDAGEKQDEADMESFDFTMNAGLKGAFLFSREALGMMKKQKYGTIINIVPQTEEPGGWTADSDGYSAMKAGLVYLTKTLAKRSAKYGITVKGVSAKVEENMQKNGEDNIIVFDRNETIKEVADTVLFLASDHARHMTGTCIDVSGNLAV